MSSRGTRIGPTGVLPACKSNLGGPRAPLCRTFYFSSPTRGGGRGRAAGVGRSRRPRGLRVRRRVGWSARRPGRSVAWPGRPRPLAPPGLVAFVSRRSRLPPAGWPAGRGGCASPAAAPGACSPGAARAPRRGAAGAPSRRRCLAGAGGVPRGRWRGCRPRAARWSGWRSSGGRAAAPRAAGASLVAGCRVRRRQAQAAPPRRLVPVCGRRRPPVAGGCRRPAGSASCAKARRQPASSSRRRRFPARGSRRSSSAPPAGSPAAQGAISAPQFARSTPETLDRI